jgi:hypothetical protein
MPPISRDRPSTRTGVDWFSIIQFRYLKPDLLLIEQDIQMANKTTVFRILHHVCIVVSDIEAAVVIWAFPLPIALCDRGAIGSIGDERSQLSWQKWLSTRNLAYARY